MAARLIVKRKILLLEALLDRYSNDVVLTLEGDLSQLDLRGLYDVTITAGAHPTDTKVIIPIDAQSIVRIKQNILPRIGLQYRVAHITIDSTDGQPLFWAYDWFDKDCVGVGSLDEETLKSLVQRGIIRSYEWIQDSS